MTPQPATVMHGRKLQDLPLDLTVVCIALLPLAEGTRCRTTCRRFHTLGGAWVARCRAELGVCELRLYGAVASDPRYRRAVCGCQEAARVAMALQPKVALAAKDLLQIKGAELEAVMDGLDRAALDLEVPSRNTQQMGTDEVKSRARHDTGALRHWDSQGTMSQAEVYAVIAGQLHLVGSPQAAGGRWMMRMEDVEENFAQVQNARLYVSEVQAEYTAGMQPSEDSKVLERNGTQVHPDQRYRTPATCDADSSGKGIRGRLLFCALEV